MVLKVARRSGLHHPMTEKLSVNLAVNGTFFESRKDKAGKGKGIAFPFHLLCPRYSGSLNPHCP